MGGDVILGGSFCDYSEPTDDDQAFIAAANPTVILELLDRLETAEQDALEQARLNGMGAERELALIAKLEAAEKEREIDEQRIADLMADLNRVGHENDALRAKVEAAEKSDAESLAMYRRAMDERDALRAKLAEMEKQEPVAWTTKLALEYGASKLGFQVSGVNMWGEKGVPLYALPGAKGEIK